ncbi:FadR/GntR family transcriptional regulator [Treponema sp.]
METLRRSSLSDAVIDYFRQKIQSGEWKPGEKVPSERMLIERLGISRFSLREGLARLNALGVITIRQGSGSFICDTVQAHSLRNVLLPMQADLGKIQFDDLREARANLETAIVRKVAKNRTEEDIKELSLILAQAALAFNEAERFAMLDARFHQVLGRIAGNSFMMRMQEMLLSAVEEFIGENSKSSTTRRVAQKDHERIYEKIVASDSEAAARAMQRHIDTCAANFSASQSGGNEL